MRRDPDSARDGRRVGPEHRIYPMPLDPNFHELEYFVAFEQGAGGARCDA